MKDVYIFVLLPDNDSTSRFVKSVEGYEDYPKKSDSGGVGGTTCIYARYQSTKCNSHIGFMIYFIFANSLFFQLGVVPFIFLIVTFRNSKKYICTFSELFQSSGLTDDKKRE